MENEMERGDGGKVGERESQRAARREDVGETKRRKADAGGGTRTEERETKERWREIWKIEK